MLIGRAAGGAAWPPRLLVEILPQEHVEDASVDVHGFAMHHHVAVNGHVHALIHRSAQGVYLGEVVDEAVLPIGKAHDWAGDGVR